MSLDHTPLIYHNRTLLSVGGGLRRVRTQSAAELSQLNAASGFANQPAESLPLLDDVLSRYGGKCVLLLEIKRREPDSSRFQTLMDLVIEQVQRRQLTESVCILCYNADLLAYGHQRAPGLKYVLNQDRPQYLPDADFLFAYSANIKGLKPDFAEKVRGSGRPLLTFTCNTERHLKRALQCGVNGVMSDNPAWLTHMLQQKSGIKERP